MFTKMPSSKEFLKTSITSHANLAKDLLSMAESDETNNSNNRFQIASIIIFLAGVEKMLNIAFGILFLAGKVSWNWMTKGSRVKPEAGFITCTRGLTSKIYKMKEFGVDITDLLKIIDLRNYFIHNSNIYIGYSHGIDELTMRPHLFPVGPQISYPLSPSTSWNDKYIQYYTNNILEVVSSFIDTTEWKSRWIEISQKLEKLPVFTIQTKMAGNPGEFGSIEDKVYYLNEKYIGDGLVHLLQSF